VRFERYVAIGDSSTEGLDDPDGRGGYRGWADRLAMRLAEGQGGLLYANFGVRGLRTREIRDRQLEWAVALRPDLATLFCGTNDLIGGRFDAAALANDVEHMQSTLIRGGATVLTFTLPDLTPIMPLARLLRARSAAMNAALRGASTRSGALLVDFARYPVATDARLWSEDRIHANSLGHARIADALADALGLSGADDEWKLPLPEPPQRGAFAALAAEWRWGTRHLLPWLWQSTLKGTARETRRGKREALEQLSGEP
jgi:lysophospholipase L1-like esterase